MVLRHSSGIHHSCMRLLSCGVPWQGASDAVGRSQGQTGSSWSVTSLPQFLSKLPEKTQ